MHLTLFLIQATEMLEQIGALNDRHNVLDGRVCVLEVRNLATVLFQKPSFQTCFRTAFCIALCSLLLICLLL